MQHISKLMGAKREMHSTIYQHEEIGESSYQQLNSTLETPEQKEASTHKINGRQEIVNLGDEIKKIETKRTIQTIYKTRSLQVFILRKLTSQTNSYPNYLNDRERISK